MSFEEKKRDLHINVHSSLKHNSKKQKRLKHLSTRQGINKSWYSYTMEHYSVIEVSKLLINETTWKTLHVVQKKPHTHIQYINIPHHCIYIKFQTRFSTTKGMLLKIRTAVSFVMEVNWKRPKGIF